MSIHDHAPSPEDDGSVQEQIPHSGVHHDEAPVEIDTMPLQEAFDKGRLETPTSPAALLEPGTTEAPSRWSLKQKLGASAATVIVGAGAILGISKAVGGGESTDPTNTSPVATATANPGDTVTSTPETQNPYDKYRLNVDQYSTFESAAAQLLKNIDEYLQSGQDTYDQPGDPKILDAILGEGWRDNPELAAMGESLEQMSITVSTNHFATGENGGTEYEQTTEVTGVRDTLESADELSGFAAVHSTDNIMDTVLSMNAEANLDSTGEFHYTFKNVDGFWQLVEFDNLANNNS